MAMNTGTDKTCDLTTLVSHVRQGDCVAIGGGLSLRVPMAAVRELVRQRIDGLELVGSAHGIDVDMLCGAGLVSVCAESYVGFEQDFGTAMNYRRACESGRVKVRDTSCYTLVQQLRAAASGLPFMPIRSVRGTDFMGLHPEYRTLICPFSGQELVLVPALRPDVAILHAQLGDPRGNLVIQGPPVVDKLFARAAGRVVATVERVVPAGQIGPGDITIPGFYVSAVAEVRYGAHPTSCYPLYAYDRVHTAEYYRGTLDSDRCFRERYLDPFVYRCRSHDEYLHAVGGGEAMKRLQSWSENVESWRGLYEQAG